VRRLPAPCLAVCAALLVAAGCGEGGAGEGATVSVYAAAPLCREAQKSSGKAADLEVRVVCLPATAKDGRADLAAVGAAA
jgi:hypothetical protein